MAEYVNNIPNCVAAANQPIHIKIASHSKTLYLLYNLPSSIHPPATAEGGTCTVHIPSMDGDCHGRTVHLFPDSSILSNTWPE